MLSTQNNRYRYLNPDPRWIQHPDANVLFTLLTLYPSTLVRSAQHVHENAYIFRPLSWRHNGMISKVNLTDGLLYSIITY